MPVPVRVRVRVLGRVRVVWLHAKMGDVKGVG